MGPWTREELFKGCSVQNANESFGVADAVPGTWEEIAGPLRPIRVLRLLIGFHFAKIRVSMTSPNFWEPLTSRARSLRGRTKEVSS